MTKNYRLPLLLLVSTGSVITLVLGISSALVLSNGPHPECGVNAAVGPCDTLGAIFSTAQWSTVPGLYMCLITMCVTTIIYLLRGPKS